MQSPDQAMEIFLRLLAERAERILARYDATGQLAEIAARAAREISSFTAGGERVASAEQRSQADAVSVRRPARTRRKHTADEMPSKAPAGADQAHADHIDAAAGPGPDDRAAATLNRAKSGRTIQEKFLMELAGPVDIYEQSGHPLTARHVGNFEESNARHLLERRACQEDAAAEEAGHPAARLSHLRLASLYWAAAAAQIDETAHSTRTCDT